MTTPIDAAVSRLVLGWQLTAGGNPRYWLHGDAKPGGQADLDLVCVPANAMATHTVIAAQSGSGKSFFLGRLLEEILVRTKARCLIFDPNADFRSMHEVKDERLWVDARYDTELRGGFLPHESARAKFVAAWAQVQPRIMTNARRSSEDSPYRQFQLWWPSLSSELISQGLDAVEGSEVYHCHAFVQAIAALIDIFYRDQTSRPDLIDTAEELFNIKLSENLPHRSRTYKPLATVLTEKFSVTALPRTGLVLGLRMPRIRARNLVEQAVTVLEYVSEEVGRCYFAKAREYKAARILASLPPSAPTPAERLDVIDLPSLAERNTRLLAINALLQTEWNRVRGTWSRALEKPQEEDDRAPTFVVVDEAHNFMAAGPIEQREAALREQFRTIAAEGRKYGLFLVIVTQRPDKLDPLIVSECENKALMRLDSEAVLKVARETLGLEDVPQSTLAKCVQFGVGRVLLAGRWADGGAQELYSAARRTVEGGRNLRPEYWARPFPTAEDRAGADASRRRVARRVTVPSAAST